MQAAVWVNPGQLGKAFAGQPVGRPVRLYMDDYTMVQNSVTVADYDEDGFVDIAKTNFSDDVPNLYHNNHDGTFTDRVYEAGLGGWTGRDMESLYVLLAVGAAAMLAARLRPSSASFFTGPA